jgi:hypothetical protein
MSYIVPNSQVQLFKNVPLNKDSEDTIYFKSPTEQDAYFRNSVSATFSASNFAFIKKEQQAIRVDAGYSKVYKSNYMRFNNTQSGNKWFYAFITDVVYINEGVTEIQYEIDVMQTWLPQYDYFLRQCYVEREHSKSDNFGEHTLDEGLDLGRLVYEQVGRVNFKPKYCGVMLSAVDSNIPLVPTVTLNYLYDYIPSGYLIVIFDMFSETSRTALGTFISDPDLKDGIMGCYTIPEGLLTDDDLATATLNTTTRAYNLVYIKSISAPPETIYIPFHNGEEDADDVDGYKPRNKKVLTYPFCKLVATNSKGARHEYRYENFEESEDYKGAIEFERYASISVPMTATIIPKHYAERKNGLTTWHDGCRLSEKFSMSISAIGGYSGSLYESNLMQQLPNVLATVAGIAAAGATSGLSLAAAVHGGTQLVNQLSQKDATSVKSSNPDNLDTGNNFVSFDFFRETVTAETAKRIDNFFHAYGYRCDSYKTPNINVRERWTYTKTQGANHLSKNVPAGDMALINKKFDSGIRFHKSAETIGYTNSYSNGIREV